MPSVVLLNPAGGETSVSTRKSFVQLVWGSGYRPKTGSIRENYEALAGGDTPGIDELAPILLTELDDPTSEPSKRLRAAFGTGAVRITAGGRHGAVGDANQSYFASMTAGQKTLTSVAVVGFSPDDVGKPIYVEDAGAQGALWTTIQAFVSTTEVTLTDAAVNTVSMKRALWGTDDTAAFAAAIAEAGDFGQVEIVKPDNAEGYIVDMTTLRDGLSIGSNPHQRARLFRKPETLSNDHWAVFVAQGASTDRWAEVLVHDLVIDGSGPRGSSGYVPASAGGTPGLHKGVRIAADEDSLEGINLKFVDRWLVRNVEVMHCIGDGLDVDDCQDGYAAGVLADDCRVGFHNSNGSRRNTYDADCVARFCQQGFDQSTQSGRDAVENRYFGQAYNNRSQNFNIMATTEASAPGNPNGLNPAPVGPFYGVTAAKFSVGAGSITVDSTVGNFQGSDVGKPITLYGAGASGANLKTTIAAVLTTTRLQIAVNASTAVAETENKPLVYGYGAGTAVVNNIRSITQAVDVRDGRTGRAPATHDLFVGVRPPGLYKDDFGNTQGGGLGLAASASTEYAGMASHNYSGSDPARVLYRIFFGNNPNFRRVEYGAKKEAGNAVGFGVATSPSGNSLVERWYVDGQGNVILNASGAALPTTATNGFTYLPSMAGPPTGVPAASYTGTVRMVYDTASSKLWVHDGGVWKSVTLA